jgi:hypothetical protein
MKQTSPPVAEPLCNGLVRLRAHSMANSFSTFGLNVFALLAHFAVNRLAVRGCSLRQQQEFDEQSQFLRGGQIANAAGARLSYGESDGFSRLDKGG